MDAVRFGRALGVGAKSAARAVAVAVDAAKSPNPSPVKPRPASAGPIANAAQTTSRPINLTLSQTAARATVKARQTSEDFARGGKRFGEAIWGPLVKISSVLWLEITGAFFGIFALFAGQAAWSHRTDFYSTAADRDARLRAFVFLAMAIGFGYFCVSSFFRARRRERRS